MCTPKRGEGRADAAADELALTNREVLQITFEDEIAKEGFGRIGELPETLSLADAAQYVKQVFGIDRVKVFGNLDEEVKVAKIAKVREKVTEDGQEIDLNDESEVVTETEAE